MNDGIRTKSKDAGIPLWEVALFAGISEPTITRWLRTPLSHEKEERLLMAIEHAKKAREG